MARNYFLEFNFIDTITRKTSTTNTSISDKYKHENKKYFLSQIAYIYFCIFCSKALQFFL